MKLLRTTFLENSSWRLLLTLQLHKWDKNVSRYCNKYIKVISIEALLVTLCQLWKWFCTVRKVWQPPSGKTYQNHRNLQGMYLWQSFVIVKPFFADHFNFTYDSEVYDLMELYLETSHSEFVRKTALELFCWNGQRIKAVGYFRRRSPSWMFDRILNVTLPNNLL